MSIKIKRVYEKKEKEDGFRILIDRLWPRGLTKDEANVDLWFKEIAPSNDLREWFSHDVNKWDEFKKRYTNELKENNDAVNQILEKAEKHNLTLLYSAKNTEHNNAVVLKNYLEKLL